MSPSSSSPPMLPLLTTGAPIGSVIAFAGQIGSPPVNPSESDQSISTVITENTRWMLCDGSTLTIAEFGPLYIVIGTQYNTGKEAAGQFSIPDYRGYFLRMTDLGSGNDPDTSGRVLPNGTTSSEVGSIQQDALQTHEHSYSQPKIAAIPAGTASANAVTTTPDALTGTPTDNLDNPPGNVRISSFETRAKNVYVNYLIKYI